jgi:hypothetical protein
MKRRAIWSIVLLMVAFYTIVPLLASYHGWPFFDPEITYDTPINSHLTEIFRSRGSRTYYFNEKNDENNLVQHTFYSFQPAASPLPRAVLTRDEQAEIAEQGLGPYLREGDYLVKAAHDSVLAVHRRTRTTYWVCPAPQKGHEKNK